MKYNNFIITYSNGDRNNVLARASLDLMNLSYLGQEVVLYECENTGVEITATITNIELVTNNI
jgi:hypothetical protein